MAERKFIMNKNYDKLQKDKEAYILKINKFILEFDVEDDEDEE